MKRAIVTHLRDFVAMAVIVAIAVGVGGYILRNQGVRFPILEEGPHKIWVEVQNARGVTPGQGQTVRVAGMRVGDVGDVKLKEGKALVRMDLDPEHAKLVRRDATVLLRPRTGLKDMFLALDPGSPDRPAVKEGGVIDSSNTLPDVNADEVLEALDTDTRAYLGLLINGAGLGLKDRDQDLRQVFARLRPLHRDLRELNTEVVKRKRNLRRLINNYGSTISRLSKEDRDLTRLVVSADRVFDRLAKEDERISLAVSRLPTTLRQAESTLLKVSEFADTAGPAFRALRPAVREIDEANSELLPLAQTAEPVLREKIRPFVRRAQPYVRNLRPAARDLGTASPNLRKTFYQLNRLFNTAAFNPGGAEGLTGDSAKDLARDEGFLFWLAWVSHNSNSLFQTGDAQGPFRRFVLLATCSTYQQMLLESGPTAPILEDLLGVKDLLSDARVCTPLMIKETPSLGRIIAMVGFTLSCFGILVFLWLAFGGPIPLRPESYRFEASFKEAALLVKEADVRIAGLNVGKVKGKRLDEKNGATIAELEIDPKYAPIPKDTKAILRIKALLGETYVELSPGNPKAGTLADGGMLPTAAVEEAVEIDEIISLFDKPTRDNFQGWIRELATAIDKGRGENLNDAIGNLPRFVASADDVLTVLDEEEPAVRALIRNSGRTLEAVNERRLQLRQLIGNADDTFGALASRNEALAETIKIFPTFLDESRATFSRLKRFSNNTRPLVRDLIPVAEDLRPTLQDVGDLAPNLKALFRDLDPLIDESPETLPSAARFIAGAEPVFESLNPYLDELNPVLSYLNYQQQQVADFITNGGGSFTSSLPPLNPSEGPRHYLRAYSASNSRSLGIQRTRQSSDRGNAYPTPNYLRRARPLEMTEAFDCKPGGVKRDPTNGEPPCLVAPPQLWDGGQYPRVRSRGQTPIKPNPLGNDGSKPAILP